MAGRALSFRDWLRLSGALLLALVVIAALRWRHDIVQTTLHPKLPFRTYPPPHAPASTPPAAWAPPPPCPARATFAAPSADVFFVYPTSFDGGSNWNGPLAN